MTTSRLRRVGVLGDIHTEDQLLEAALRFLRTQALDAVLAVGDIVDGRGDAQRCCDLLADAGVLAVRGNHERWFLRPEPAKLPDATPRTAIDARGHAFLASLPETRWLPTESGPVLLCHGMGSNDMEGIWPDEPDSVALDKSAFRRLQRAGQVDLVINGHTHQRMVRRIGGVTIVNAGTLARSDCPCFAVIDFVAGTVEYYDLRDDGSVTAAETFQLPPRAQP